MLAVLVTAVMLVLMLVLGSGEQAAAQGKVCTKNTSCRAAEYRAKGVGGCEGHGTCAPRLTNCLTCPPILEPVCDCDGQTYPNACAAAAVGVSVDHTGPCLGVAVASNPSVRRVEDGQVATVNIVAIGLEGELISAFDLEVHYDPAILELAGVTFGPGLSSGTASSLQDSASTPGAIDLAEVSLLADAELEAMQQAGHLLLVTLSFTAIRKGTSPLTFVFDQASDVKGAEAQLLILEARGDHVLVSTLSVLTLNPAVFPIRSIRRLRR